MNSTDKNSGLPLPLHLTDEELSILKIFIQENYFVDPGEPVNHELRSIWKKVSYAYRERGLHLDKKED